MSVYRIGLLAALFASTLALQGCDGDRPEPPRPYPHHRYDHRMDNHAGMAHRDPRYTEWHRLHPNEPFNQNWH